MYNDDDDRDEYWALMTGQTYDQVARQRQDGTLGPRR